MPETVVTTRGKRTHVGEVSSLPKWAQEYIARQQNTIDQQQRALQDGLNGSGITVEMAHGRVRSIRVPKDRVIHANSNWTDGVHVLFDHGVVEVRGSHCLQINLTASNVCRISDGRE